MSVVLRSGVLPRWLGIFGLLASGIYLLNQGDILATAVPGFPVWEPAGFLGSTLCGLWVAALGVCLPRGAGSASRKGCAGTPGHRRRLGVLTRSVVDAADG